MSRKDSEPMEILYVCCNWQTDSQVNNTVGDGWVRTEGFGTTELIHSCDEKQLTTVYAGLVARAERQLCTGELSRGGGAAGRNNGKILRVGRLNWIQ